jgi:hypothetical protein
MKIASQCREQAGQVYNVAVFEIEKEIPIQIGLVLWSGGGVAVQRRGRAEAALPEARRDNTLSSPARLDLASPGVIPTSVSAVERPQRGSG